MDIYSAGLSDVTLPPYVLDEDVNYTILQKTVSIKFYDLAGSLVYTQVPFDNVLLASSDIKQAKKLANRIKYEFEGSGSVSLIDAKSFLQISRGKRMSKENVYIVYANLNSVAECEFNNLVDSCSTKLIGKFPELSWHSDSIGHVSASKKSHALISKLPGELLETKRQLAALLPQYFLLCLGERYFVRRLEIVKAGGR